MTNYWWMHWFWITLIISVSNVGTFPIAVHSNSTIPPAATVSLESRPTGKVIVNFTNPPTIQHPSTATKITTSSKNISASTKNPVPAKNVAVLKSTKAHIKKIDFFFHNVTARNKTKDDKETVITPRMNETTLVESINVTESQVLINSSFSGVPHTDNLTYLQEETNGIQNMEKIGSEEVEDKVDGLEELGSNLSAAGITGITLGCVVVVGIVCGLSYFMYHNRGFNRPQVLNDHCSNPDSSGYIDDASVRDNSEEMYSLDNDSFLNSLEAMTIQNYWTDTVKHTKL